MIWSLLIFCILLGLSAVLCYSTENRISRFLLEKMDNPFFLSSFFPVFGTLFLTISLNIALINIEYFINNIWETLILEICFGVTVFFLVDKIQKNLTHTVFEESINEFYGAINDSHWVQKSFAREFFKGMFKKDKFLDYAFTSEASDLAEVVLKMNSLETILAGLNNTGIELSNYLYSRLLYHCLLSRGIHKLYSIWDVSMVGLELELYGDYTTKLTSIYASIDDESHKQRVFIFKDATHFSEIDKPDNGDWQVILQKHQEWGFTKLHYCFNNQLESVKKGIVGGVKRLEDFTLCSNSKKKWGAGKDKDNEKVFFISDTRIIDETEHVFKTLVNIAEENDQFKAV